MYKIFIYILGNMKVHIQFIYNYYNSSIPRIITIN